MTHLKYTPLLFGLVLLSTTLIAQSDCVKGDCEDGVGELHYGGDKRYVGNFVKGEFHGAGTCYYGDGSVFRGFWQHRYPHGKGEKTLPDGRKIKGTWEMGLPVGEATLVSADGRAQRGTWSDNVLLDRHGEALVEEFAAKTAGVDNTEIPTGCLAGNCQEGEGVFGFADGGRYEGEFVGGQFNGWGTYYYPQGERYVGPWKNHRSHGQGKYYDLKGNVVEGTWEAGQYIADKKEGFESYRNCNDTYCAEGEGRYEYKGGTYYIGEFKDGKPHGEGVVYYSDGARYEGEWKYDNLNGYGTVYTKDNIASRTGYWKDGRVVQQQMVNTTPTEPTPTQYSNIAITNSKDQKVYAVVIGVSSYTKMMPLDYTDDDAYRFHSFLKSPEGGALRDEQIRLVMDKDATRENILNNMREMFSQADEDDLVLLYFSGHGVRGSFLPVDYDGDKVKVTHAEINEIFNASRAKFKLCIADACHSGGFRAKGDISTVIQSYYENLAQAKGGTALLLSSRQDETSLEASNLRQGVFSHFLIRGLKGEADSDNDGTIEIQELYDFIHINVRSYTANRQSPVIKGDYDRNMPLGVVRR